MAFRRCECGCEMGVYDVDEHMQTMWLCPCCEKTETEYELEHYERVEQEADDAT